MRPAAGLLILLGACAAPAPARPGPCAASEPRHLLNAAQALPGPQPGPPPGGAPASPLGALGALLLAASALLGPAATPIVAGAVGVLGAALRK